MLLFPNTPTPTHPLTSARPPTHTNTQQDGYVFGGFADESWMVKSHRYGDSNDFVFTLAPKMAVYPATGINDHYQYQQHGAKTMVNGTVWERSFPFGGRRLNDYL